MHERVECGCGATLTATAGAGMIRCASCGADAPVPPRTVPPRHAAAMADAVYDRVARGTRTRRRPRPAAWRTALLGVGLLAVAAVVFGFRLDLGLMSVPSLGLAVAGLVVVLKAAMGYGR